MPVKPDSIPPAPPLESETILLVEDDKDMRNMFRHILQQRGYTVLFAGEGEAALRVSRQHIGPIHLLLSDVVMPGMSGSQLFEKIRALRPNIRVLFISGLMQEAAVLGGTRPGVGFLPKPFTPEALVEKVQELLRAGS